MSQTDSYLPLVAKLNQLCLGFLETNSSFVKLGPAYSHMSLEDATQNLVLHRMHKKFAAPVDSVSEERRANTIASMLQYDADGITDFAERVRNCEDPFIRRQLYQSRVQLHEVISAYRFGVSDLEFPSGETYVSSSGNTSLYAKLKDRKQWCCTPECFDLFAKLAYNSPILKYAARKHLREWQLETKKKFDNFGMLEKAKSLGMKNIRFAIFKAKLREIITFVIGARITTVSKDLVVDRVIECEAFCNMCCQLAIDGSIKSCIKEFYGVDLLSSQIIHKLMLADSNNATIDFSNASNSTWNSVVKWFLGSSRLGKDLQASRCGYVDLPNEDVASLNMLSPMGNGFTFSVMTLLLMVISRSVDSFAHVFGDDVIVDNTVAPTLIEIFRFVGYETNNTKTFVDSSFRESCGGFICHGKYLTSFDFEWANDVVDAVILTNKVKILSDCYPWFEELKVLHADLLSLWPPHLLRATDDFVDWAERINRQVVQATLKNDSYSSDFVAPLPSLDDGVWCHPKYVRKMQRGCAKTAKAYKKLKAALAVDTCVPSSNVLIVPYVRIQRKADCYRFKNGRPMEPVNNVSRLFGWFYIYNGRVQAPTVENEVYKVTWNFVYSK